MLAHDHDERQFIFIFTFPSTACDFHTPEIIRLRISCPDSTPSRFRANSSWCCVVADAAADVPVTVLCSRTPWSGSCSPQECTSFLWRRGCTAAGILTARCNTNTKAFCVYAEHIVHVWKGPMTMTDPEILKTGVTKGRNHPRYHLSHNELYTFYMGKSN